MEKTKLEILQELKERISGQELAMGKYKEEQVDGTCQFCAVGHLLAITDLDAQEIFENYNERDVDALPEKFLIPLEVNYEFESEELETLQLINDSALPTKRTSSVLSWIEQKIEREIEYADY